MKFLSTLLLGLLFTVVAHAATATSELSWTAPDTRVDGTVLAPSEISEYRVYYTIDGQAPDDSTPITVSGTSASETVTLELLPRTTPYVISFAITTVDTDGLESARSETVSKTFQVDSTAAPGAPTQLQFNITCVDGCTVTEVGFK